MFRTPLLPFEELEAWSAGLEAVHVPSDRLEELERALAADRVRLRERLRALCDRPEILEALFLASPSLVDGLPLWLSQPDSKKGQRVERVIVRYFYRMTARATPFGLFSGCSLGPLAAETRLTLGPRPAYERHTRLDMDYLFALCEELGRDPRIREGLLYRPNSSLYRAAGRLRYAEARLVKKVRSHHLVAVEPTDYLEDTLGRASAGARIADLASALVASDPDGEISFEDAAEYIGELIDSQILVSDLSPLVTGPEAIHELIELLRGLPGDAPLASTKLAQARDELAALDAGGPGSPPERYRALAQALEVLPTPVELARLFQLDMVKPGDRPALGSAVLDEALQGIDLLRRLSPRRQDLLDTFRKDFTERYGEGREVLLVEALDEEIGIGFERSSDVGAEASPLLHGLPLAPPAADASVTWGARESYLFDRLTQALATGAQEIELTPKDIERLSPYSGPDGGEVPHLADAFQMMIHVAAASPEALAGGEFQILLGGAVGPSGARLLGRFCHADPELHRQVEAHLRQEEAHRPDAIYAEIVHLPQGRIGNILSRPVLRPHEIPFLGRSGALPENQIPITDLTVTVRGSRIILRSRRLGREVIPRLTSAHNYRRGSLGIYRFLCMLQTQGTQGGAVWSWGALDSSPFLPRVTAGRLVLARATWVITGDEIKEIVKPAGAGRFIALRAWRERRRIPRLVTLTDGDNELLVDFENVLSVETFLDLIEERDRARLSELYPDPDRLVARGPEGRFLHEILIPFVGRPREATRAVAREATGAAAAAPALRRVFPPGSEWLYVKLYTGTSTADGLLRDVVGPAVREALASGVADSWFFLRYADPEWHLRVRLHGDPAALHGRVLPALHESLAGFMADGRLWKVQLDTYDREVERYGGQEGIELAERLFRADSDAVLEIVEMIEGDEGADIRWRLALLGCDLLLSDLGLTPEAKQTAVEHLRTSFLREFKGGKPLRVQLDQKLRAERRSLGEMLEGGAGLDDILAPALDVLTRRSRAIAPIAEEMRAREAAGRLTVPVAEMSTSFVHMFVNRIIRSAARAHELVLYDFLHQLHASREARRRKNPSPPAPLPQAGEG
ncbi:MAG TPA: lantibiotic dehydratase [Thermoanaerobaculia bacterium]|nr:lantibiotic dehydratase [Thermoanaerobaculia bacterium]